MGRVLSRRWLSQALTSLILLCARPVAVALANLQAIIWAGTASI
jgi:hypothetical protein